MSTLDELLHNNARYAEGFAHGGLPARPSRPLAVVACMDARLDVYRVLGLGAGEAHVLRNAGGIVTDDVLRSLVISQRLLSTREIVLIQHTDCGMMTMREDEVRSSIAEETGQALPFDLGGFDDLERSLERSVAKIRACPFLPHTGEIRAFIYDVGSGSLTEVLT